MVKLCGMCHIDWRIGRQVSGSPRVSGRNASISDLCAMNHISLFFPLSLGGPCKVLLLQNTWSLAASTAAGNSFFFFFCVFGLGKIREERKKNHIPKKKADLDRHLSLSAILSGHSQPPYCNRCATRLGPRTPRNLRRELGLGTCGTRAPS
jgi:hypothetical protein